MRVPRFALLWAIFSGLYLLCAIFGPHGPGRNGRWLPVNQHLLQVRSWLGEGTGRPSLEVSPALDPRDLAAASVALADLVMLSRKSADTGQTERHYYVGFPPGPAFLLLPLRLLLRGWLAAQWLGAILGGLAVAAMDALLFRWMSGGGGSEEANPLRPSRNALALLVGMGTLWVWLAPYGLVWHFAQTVGTTGLALALLAGWRRRWILSGLAFAFALTSRPLLLLSLPLLLWRLGQEPRDSRRSACLRFAAAPFVFSSLMLLLNQLRFGSPFDFGYAHMLLAAEAGARYHAHGQFSLAFLPENLRWLILQPPVLVRDPRSGGLAFPWLLSDPKGMGVFFVTPAYLAAALALKPAWMRRPGVQLVWICWAVCTIPALIYFNTGWKQWGGRFLIDAWPFWLMLTALGLSRLRPRLGWALIGLSVLSNAWAASLTVIGSWPP